MASATTFYDFAPKDMKDKPFPLSQFEGKVVLVVNVASKCGFTGHYEGLESLYKSLSQEYPDQFTIIGFPCNQFGGQEPGSNEEIISCGLRYNVTFPVLAKVNVNDKPKSNEVAEPLWKWLTSQKKAFGSFMLGNDVAWNFEKILIGRDGKVKERWRSLAKPATLEASILKELKTEWKPKTKPETEAEPRPESKPEAEA